MYNYKVVAIPPHAKAPGLPCDISVVAIETNHNWYVSILQEIEKRNLKNITYIYCPKQDLIELTINSLERNFSIVSVDSVFGYNRSKFLNLMLENNRKNNRLKVVALGNYANSALFPDHYNLSLEEIGKICSDSISAWSGKDFDDPNWVGNGTRIMQKVV